MADNVRLGSASLRSLISKLNSGDSNIVQDSEHDQPEKVVSIMNVWILKL